MRLKRADDQPNGIIRCQLILPGLAHPDKVVRARCACVLKRFRPAEKNLPIMAGSFSLFKMQKHTSIHTKPARRPRLMSLSFVFLLVLGCIPMTLSANETEKSEAGVRAVEARWTHAFLSGDEVFLNHLLDDDYVSINLNGVARPKAAIIALARKIAAAPSRPAETASDSKITIVGDAAIVVDMQPDQVSVDVFHYTDGAWHAWYSQHTAVAKKP